MARANRDKVMRHEAAVEEESFVTPSTRAVPKESSIVEAPRKRITKGVNDGRGKRSVADMLLSMQTDASRAAYAMERIASLEDQIAKILDICPASVRDIIFKDRSSLKRYWSDD